MPRFVVIAAEVLFPLYFEVAGFLLFVNFSVFFFLIFSMMRYNRMGYQSALQFGVSGMIRRTAMRLDVRLCFSGS
jgi:hypothetical protein